jgi:predicted secreted protein
MTTTSLQYLKQTREPILEDIYEHNNYKKAMQPLAYQLGFADV